VQSPAERIDGDPRTAAWGLWPQVEHPDIGTVRVDGIGMHLSETDWVIDRPGPRLGQHNREVLGELLGLIDPELDELEREEGVVSASAFPGGAAPKAPGQPVSASAFPGGAAPTTPGQPVSAPAGPLDGLRVVELASELSAPAGKLLADLGADVVVVEPPGGSVARRIGPFAGGAPDPQRSLHWWYFNTSKRGLVLDLGTAEGLAELRELLGRADVLVESAAADEVTAWGLDPVAVRAEHPALVHVSVTAHGRAGGAGPPATDLTVLAESGVVWSCGYDARPGEDPLPPVRPAGGHAAQVGAVLAATGTLVAVLHRATTGRGQHVDVSLSAALNVSTESASYAWMVAGQTVRRQTGRHAVPFETQPVQVRAADGRYVTTGFLPSTAAELASVADWLAELGLTDRLAEAFFLEMGVEKGGVDRNSIDPVDLAIRGAARDALELIAQNLDALAFFEEGQRRGFQCGVIQFPDEAFRGAQSVARGFPVPVFHEELGREVDYPGAPFRLGGAPWRIAGRAPRLGPIDGRE
jgi:crotonobetainyl-CoA:carnitine CoA-transferase CaiB-like acyl-CoA transferase